jgi:Na+-translocating ferredoxin:NAD+ oxidoreductase RnfC subunit
MKIIILLICLILTSCHKDEPKIIIPKELTVESLQSVDNPFELIQKIDRNQFNDEQLKQIESNIRDVMESKINDRVNEYFACPDRELRKKLLDKQIDEMERRRQEREKQEPTTKPDDQNRQRNAWRQQDLNQSERKTRFENRNSDQTARRMIYMQAMQERIKERGIELRRRNN